MTHPYDIMCRAESPSDIYKRISKAIETNPDIDPNKADSLRLSLSLMRMFDETGRNTFVVSESLARMLARTDVGGLKTSDIRLPYPCIFVQIGDEYVCLSESKLHGCTPRVEKEGVFHQAEHYISVCTFSGPYVQTSFNSRDRTVSEIIRLTMEREHVDATGERFLPEEADLNRWGSIMSTALQFAIFLNQCPDSAVLDKDHGKRRRLRKSISRLRGRKRERAIESLVKLGSTTIYHVGAEFKEESETDTRLHWVRGHWRRQPYGPRDNPEYRLVWIKPFQRGTEEEGVVERRTYK